MACDEKSELQKVVNAPDIITKFWVGLIGLACLGAVGVSTNYNTVKQLSESATQSQRERKELQAIVSDLAAYTRENVIQNQSYQAFTDRRIDQQEMDIDMIEARLNALRNSQ